MQPFSFRLAVCAALLGAAISTGASAQTLTIGVRAGPESIDPHYAATGTHAEALKHVFDTLVWSGDKLQVEPRLALSWKLVEPTVWEFKLRPDVKFHDGSDFTAEDVKFSVERIPLVTGASPVTVYVRRIKETRIVDPLTVRFVTDGPAPTLPNDLVRLFIVSHKAAAGLTKDTASEGFNSGRAAVGTGPYKYVSWTPKNQLVLERFDGFWGEKEPWARVIRRELPNDASRVAQLKAGQVDLIARAPAADVETMKRDAKLSVVSTATIYVFQVEFSFRDNAPNISAKDGTPLQKNPLQDTRVREAIDLAIDRSALTEFAMEELGTPANQLVTESIAGFNKALPMVKPDIPKAKRLLEGAGYPGGFKITFSFTNDRLPGDRQVGTSIAQMLARIGIDVVANGQPSAVFNPARARGEYGMAMAGWGTLTGEANYTYGAIIHSHDPAKRLGSFNLTGYANATADKLIEQSAIELDDVKRNAVLAEVGALVAKERPRLPIAVVGSAWAMQRAKVTIRPRIDEDTLAMDIKPVTR